MGLTIKEIENAKPRDKRYKIADGGGRILPKCHIPFRAADSVAPDPQLRTRR